MLFSSRKEPGDLAQRLATLEDENGRLRRAVEELSLLNDLAREIGAAHDLNGITKRIVRQALRAVDAEQGVLAVLDEEPEAEPEAMRTLVRTAIHTSEHPALRADQQIVGWMHRYRRPLRLDAPRTDPRFAGVVWPETVTTVLAVPLAVHSRLVGALTVFNKHGGPFTEEDERLLSIIAGQSAQVIENARLREDEKELIRMQESLRLAQRIQTSLLPDRAPAIPGYDLAGFSLPAETVGGDYFDFIPVDEHRLAVCVGDVVGKGLPASLLMANVQATIRGQTQPDVPPSLCLERAHHFLRRTLRAGAFVTLFYGVLDTEAHRLTSANAGHNRPFLLRADGTLDTLTHGGLVLGAPIDPTYEDATHDLHPGDLLLIYSDGLTEAMNAGREEFGEERVGDLLRAHRHGSAEAAAEALAAAVRTHAGDTPQSDDVTLIVVKREARTNG